MKLRISLANHKGAIFGAVVSIPVLLAALSAQAGEKINFSESKKPLDAPNSPGQDKGDSSIQELIRRDSGHNSLSPDVELPAQPLAPQLAPAAKKKLLEYLDKKQNWIFNSADKLDKEPNVAEMFGVRDSSIGGSDKPKTSMETFFEEKPDRKKRAGDRSSGDNLFGGRDRPQSDQNLKGGSLEPQISAPDGVISELNFNNFLHQDIGPGNLDAGSKDLSRNRFDPAHLINPKVSDSAKDIQRAKDQEHYAEDFQKLLQSSGSTRSVAVDPLNSQPDSTRQELNPIMSRQIDALRGAGEGNFEVRNIGNGLAGRLPSGPSALDSLNNRMSSGSGILPSFSAPSPAFHLDAKPMILDIPKRKI